MAEVPDGRVHGGAGESDRVHPNHCLVISEIVNTLDLYSCHKHIKMVDVTFFSSKKKSLSVIEGEQCRPH
jgi:hypothetical protein